MFERRQFVSSCLATALSTGAFSAVSTRSFGLEDTVRAQLDAEFVEAIRRIASLRETNRSTAINVTYLFKQITDTHRLSDLRDFLSQRYTLTREREGIGRNIEYAYVNADALRAFDSRFLRLDRLDLLFRYSENWKEIVEFKAGLGNLSGI